MVLHVGSCQPRKNLAVLLRALTHIPQALLVQVGGQPTADLQALISELHLEARLRWAGSVSESELHAHYRAAAAFVFPSTYEGFGLPVLEAMAAGVPVICSNATSLPEVADEAALLFDPHDVETLAAHLRATLTDPALRARLIASGRRQSERFTWENTARATLAVYQQLA
jgi:alpha-1,3-rhamnosyl/mannosyltransferase